MPASTRSSRSGSCCRARATMSRPRSRSRHGTACRSRPGAAAPRRPGNQSAPASCVDTSKYLNRVLAVDPEARTARVEPGLVLDDLNAALKPHGLRFAPDVSSSSRATVGGMMANNSSGARSVVYGKTGDHVRAQQVVLADGSAAELAPLSGPALDAGTGRRFAAGARLSRRTGPRRHSRRRDRRALPEGHAPGRRLRPRRASSTRPHRWISRA